MIEVTAAIARESPNLRSQIPRAGALGWNGRARGFGTGPSYLAAGAQHGRGPWTRCRAPRSIPAGGTCGRRVSGERVGAGHAIEAATPVLAAGVGVRHGGRLALRSASFRLDCPMSGRTAFGVAISRDLSATALVDLLAGLDRPAYGELRVLGEDLTTARGRSAVRGQGGVARRIARPQPAFRVPGLVEHAARLARLPRRDRDPLAAAIVDRLSLPPSAAVPLRAAPDVICRRATLSPPPRHQADPPLV